MGSTDAVVVVASQGEATPAAQAQQVGGYCRDTDVHASGFNTNQYARWEHCFEVPATSRDRETRPLEGGKAAARESSGEGENRPEDGRAEEQALQIAFKTTPPTRSCAHTRTDARPAGVESSSRTCAAASSSDNYFEEVLKGQAQQAEFLKQMWIQQTQMQQALQQL